MNRKTPHIDRRFAGIIAVITLFLVAFGVAGCGRKAEENTLVVGSWGGAYQEAQRKAFFEPFMKETGIKIIETSTPDYAKFYEWQEAGAATIDVVDVETYFVFQAGSKGALARINPAAYAGVNLLPSAKHEFGIATCAYADVIAWNSAKHPDWKDLTWAQFWDTTAFPGRRGLRDLPASTLEAALLATGVEPTKLYPLDSDRAFQSLSGLKGRASIALWGSGSRPIELLTSGAVELTTAWNGRVHDARKEGKPIAMTFEHGMLDWLWWVVPKDSTKGALAEKFIAFTLRPDRQAEFARLIPYGPSNQDALALLDEQTAADLPTSKANLPKLIIRDNAWWAANDERVQPKWLEWKLGVEK